MISEPDWQADKVRSDYLEGVDFTSLVQPSCYSGKPLVQTAIRAQEMSVQQ